MAAKKDSKVPTLQLGQQMNSLLEQADKWIKQYEQMESLRSIS